MQGDTMTLRIIALAVYLVGWLGYIVYYNRSTNPEIAEQRKTTRPWMLAAVCLFWPILFVWAVFDVLLTRIGRIGRKKDS
jgi:hypothetical protein